MALQLKNHTMKRPDYDKKCDIATCEHVFSKMALVERFSIATLRL
jgi:hypothetical protein